MTTKHSIRRAKARIGVSTTVARRMIDRAELYGLTSDYFTGSERAYLERKEDGWTHVRIYEGFCYVFTRTMTCVTVMPLPDWFGEKKRKYCHKDEIRDPRAFYRHYTDVDGFNKARILAGTV